LFTERVHTLHPVVSHERIIHIKIWLRLKGRQLKTLSTLNSNCSHFVKKFIEAALKT